MFVYVGKHFTATVTGTQRRRVQCEKCGSDYWYDLVRGATAIASAPYYIGQRRAAKRAQKGAAKKLAKRLARDIDPVFCPKCGWFQSAMVRELRRRQKPALKWIAIVAPIVFTAIAFITATNQTRGWDRELNKDQLFVDFVIVLAGLGVAVGALFLRRSLLNALDPNVDYPLMPAPIPGAPRGHSGSEFAAASGDLTQTPILDDRDASTSAAPAAAQSNLLSYEQLPPEMDPKGWITIQINRIPVLRNCCQCLEPTETGRMYPIGPVLKIYLPLCSLCARYRRRSHWMPASIGSTAGLILGAALAAVLNGSLREFASMIVAAIAGAIIGLGIGAIFAARLSGPVKFRGYSVTYNTVKIYFANPAFRRVFLDACNAPGR